MFAFYCTSRVSFFFGFGYEISLYRDELLSIVHFWMIVDRKVIPHLSVHPSIPFIPVSVLLDIHTHCIFRYVPCPSHVHSLALSSSLTTYTSALHSRRIPHAAYSTVQDTHTLSLIFVSFLFCILHWMPIIRAFVEARCLYLHTMVQVVVMVSTIFYIF